MEVQKSFVVGHTKRLKVWTRTQEGQESTREVLEEIKEYFRKERNGQ